MASTTPTVRQVAWVSIIPQSIFMALLCFLWWQYDNKNFLIYGSLSYLIISITSRGILANQHRKGIQEVRRGNFEKAITHFEKSYSFFKKHVLLDNWRYLFLLSSSRISYKEMALVNCAFCYSQLGEGIKAKEYYENALKEFPDSGMAKAGLNMLNSIKN